MQFKNDSNLTWSTISQKVLHHSRIFNLVRVQRKSPSGDEVGFIQIDAPHWVTIVAELEGKDEAEFLVVRQFRHGRERVGMEFPAGTVDPGEKPVETAGRELLEETGYSAAELIEIGVTSPNPAFMNNMTHTFLARGLKKVSEQNLDANELLDVYTETYSNLMQGIGLEPYNSAITVQAWYFYLIFTGVVT